MAQLDPSIILQAGRVQPLDPSALLERRAQLQLRNLDLAKQQRADAMAEKQMQTLSQVGQKYATGDTAGARREAAGAGNFDLVKKLDEMDDAQRKRTFEISQQTAPLLLSLKNIPAEKRVEALVGMAPELQQRGFTAQQIEQLAKEGVTDQTLDHVGSSAITIAEYNAQKNKDRDFGLEADKFKYSKENDTAHRGVTMRGQDITVRGQDIGHADSAASRAVTVRGQNISQANEGKAPSGYRWGPDGNLVAIPGGPGDKAAQLSKPTVGTMNSYIGNNQSIRNIDRAWTALTGSPKSIGTVGYLPDAINQRRDPKGVDARAAIANIGSLLIHDRSGAAVTIAETPRLVPFIPQVTDTEATAKKKLKQLRAALTETQDDFDSVYAGLPKYKPAPTKPTPKAPPKANNGDVDAILKKHGVIK